MSQPVIERGIPIPMRICYERKHTYPFAQMEVGDSFLVPVEEAEKGPDMRRAIAKAARQQLGKEGRKFSLRVMPDEGGVRIWRTQ